MSRSSIAASNRPSRSPVEHVPVARKPDRLVALALAAILIPLAIGPHASAAESFRANDDDGSALLATRIVGQVPGFSPDVANEEGYWYSRYSMMTLTMQSGLGVAIPMDQQFMSMIPPMISAVGAAASDPVTPPMNPALLQEVYAGGDPHYVTAPNQMDFGTLRWVGGPAKLTTLATAKTITKELEWAKMFHRDAHFGQPGVDSFGSNQRFAGMLFAAMVKAQLQSYLANPSSYAASNVGDYALLTAFSDGAGFYSDADEANNQGPNAAPAAYPAANRYVDPASAAEFASLAKAEFAKVRNSQPRAVRELSLAVQAVVWYAGMTKDASELAQSKAAIRRWGNALLRNGTDDESDDPTDRAYSVRGLIEAGRTTGDERYLSGAARAFFQMTAGFDYAHGVLRGTHKLTTEGIGEIAGAFNAAKIWLGNRIDQAQANILFGVWWEGTVNLSGIEISSPAVDQMKGAYELLAPPGRGTVPQNVLNYRYPTVPLPESAGGAYGIAPVLAASVTWDPNYQAWHVADRRFDTAGAMHTATELMWFHSDEVNGFPNVNFR